MGTESSFTNLRVIDFTIFMSGPYCTRMLVEAGADVIKVEPLTGDTNRTRAPLHEGHSAYFGHLNAGKHSVALDLKTEDGRAAARALIDGADVVVQNFRPGVMDRLGLDYETCAKTNTRLVYCSISGYGQSGPYASYPAFAQIVHAASGFDLANMSYQPGAERPPATGIYIADILAGAIAYGGIMAALYSRDRTGVGEHVDVSMFDCMVSTMVYELQCAQHGTQNDWHGYQPSRTLDGFVTVTPITEKNMRDALTVVGRSELADDPRFKLPADRERNWAELSEVIEAWSSQRTSAEAEQLLLAAGVPASRYRSVAELVQAPSAPDARILRSARDGAGEYYVAGSPVRLAGAKVPDVVQIEDLGESTRQCLERIAGYTPAQMDKLISTGVALAEDSVA